MHVKLAGSIEGVPVRAPICKYVTVGGVFVPVTESRVQFRRENRTLDYLTYMIVFMWKTT